MWQSTSGLVCFGSCLRRQFGVCGGVGSVFATSVGRFGVCGVGSVFAASVGVRAALS